MTGDKTPTQTRTSLKMLLRLEFRVCNTTAVENNSLHVLKAVDISCSGLHGSSVNRHEVWYCIDTVLQTVEQWIKLRDFILQAVPHPSYFYNLPTTLYQYAVYAYTFVSEQTPEMRNNEVLKSAENPSRTGRKTEVSAAKQPGSTPDYSFLTRIAFVERLQPSRVVGSLRCKS